MMKSLSFRTFFEAVDPLNENVQAAKDYLLKKHADKKEIKVSDIPEEDKRRILQNPRFVQVRDLTQKNPGYTLPFLKFYMEQNATLEELEEIFALLTKYKNTLSDLPMSVGDYSKYVPGEDDEETKPGYELLGDELRSFERRKKVKDFFQEMTPRMKKEFNKASEDEVEELTAISNQLKALPDVDGENAWRSFSKNMKKYDDTRTYSEYSNPRTAFLDIKKDALNFIEAWGKGEDELLASLKKLGPQAGILYAKNKYIAMSARTPEANRAVCSDTGWCIKTDSTFWSYGGGRIQLNIIDRNRPVSDPKSLLGITVNPDGTVHTSHDRPNSRVSGRTYVEILKQYYPQELVDAVKERFDREVSIKLALEKYFRDSSGLDTKKIIESLITLSKGFLSGAVSPEDWEQISGTVAEIIFIERKLTKSEFMKVFRDHGIFSAATWHVFDAIVGTDYSKDDMEKIGESVKRNLKNMQDLIDLKKAGVLDIKPKDMESMEEILKNRDEVMSEISKRM